MTNYGQEPADGAPNACRATRTVRLRIALEPLRKEIRQAQYRRAAEQQASHISPLGLAMYHEHRGPQTTLMKSQEAAEFRRRGDQSAMSVGPLIVIERASEIEALGRPRPF